MGWTTCYNWRTKQDIKDELKRDLAKRFEIIGEATCREAIYIGVKHKETQDSFIFIGLVRHNISDKTWSLKDLDENSGAFVSNCPTKLLKLCPNTKPNEYSIAWRERCERNELAKTNNKKKLASLEIGSFIELYDKKYKIIELGNEYRVQDLHSKIIYRLRKSVKKDIKPIELNTRLEKLCAISGQQGGTIHQFNEKYGVDFLTMSDDEFNMKVRL